MDPLNDIKKCICCWCDMLGYSGNLIRANWDLSDQRCKNNLERVNRLVPSFINSSVCNIATKLSFNDGFAITADLEDDGIDLCEKVVYFLDGVIVDYITMNHLDLNANQPGVRGVVSIGSRYNYDSADYTESFGRMVSFTPIKFQMNTAFSKAYIIESNGFSEVPKAEKANLYIDNDIFQFVAEVAERNGFELPKFSENTKGEIVVTVYGKNGWLADFTFDQNEIVYEDGKDYKNYGIKTKLYRFITKNTYADVAIQKAELKRIKKINQLQNS